MLGLLAKLLKALNSEASPWQLAFGFAFGLITGLTPFAGMHNILVLLIVLCFRINLTAYLLSSGAITLIAMLLDPVMASIGESILLAPSLAELWTAMYLSDFWQLSRFNNTLMMGSLATALILFIPFLFVSKKLVELYRDRFMAWFEKLRITKFVKASKFYQYYQSVAG